MALDIEKTFKQIEAAARDMALERDDAAKRRDAVLEAMARPDISKVIEAKAQASHGVYAFLAASPREPLNARHTAPTPPLDFSVAATDGSHIATDRHLPMRCYLINLGGCQITYGAHADVHLFSEPHLYTSDEDLYLSGSSGLDNVPVEGTLLGIKRTVQELQALTELCKHTSESLPILGLVDGSLILWGLAGQHYPPFVIKAMLHDGLVAALDALRELSAQRPLYPGAYISLPGTTEVANAVRLALCPYDVADCAYRCGTIRAGQRPCDAVHGFSDRKLFEAILEPGERSGVYATRSSIVRDHYGQHAILSYYVNVGEEIARVEMPAWAAENEASLGVGHALMLDQCRKGQGYPVALSEAHEQAVVTSADREQFRTMVEESLWGTRMPTYTSEKNRSKRTRWL